MSAASHVSFFARLRNRFKRAKPLILCGLALAWALAAYAANMRWLPVTWAILIAIIPLLLSGYLITQHWPRPYAWGLYLACGLGLSLLWPWLTQHIAWLFLWEHASLYSFLSVLFARSLSGPSEPLVTQIARRAHGGTLSHKQVRYTYAVTRAWALLFAAVVLISLLLFCFAPLSIWVLFANLISGLLVAAMFLLEYGVRQFALAGEPQASFSAAVRGWSAYQPPKDRRDGR